MRVKQNKENKGVISVCAFLLATLLLVSIVKCKAQTLFEVNDHITWNSINEPDKQKHFMVSFGVAALTEYVLETKFTEMGLKHPKGTAILTSTLITTLAGFAWEMIPKGTSEVGDLEADFLGAVTGATFGSVCITIKL